MLQLAKKIETIKGYINDIITVIQQYNPNTICTSSKQRKYVAQEMKQIILDNSQVEVNYMRDIADSEYYIAMQVPIIVAQGTTTFRVGTEARATITTTTDGTTVYDNGLMGTYRIQHKAPTTEANAEGWKPFNIVIRSNSNFNTFNIQNSNIIAFRGNMKGISDLSYCFMGNNNLRAVKLKNMESRNNYRMFRDCINLMKFDGDIITCDDASEMFYNCTNLRYVKIDLSNVTIATNIFYNCTALERLEIPTNSTVPDGLDLSGCTSLSLTLLMDVLLKLAPSDVKKTIYINKQLSQSQLDTFARKNYNIVTKTN